MFKILIQISLIAVFVLPSISVADKQGPESGGGGGVVYVNGEPKLIDFYNIQHRSDQLARMYSKNHSSFFEAPNTFSFERYTPVNDPAFLLVLDIFNKWSGLPYDSIGLFINSAIFKPVIWSFTDESVIAPKFYRPLFLPSDLEIKTAAYYLKHDRSYQVRISRDIWNKLSIQDQAGLLIHETLRHVQIGLSFGFDDEALQKATAIMLTCKPKVKLDQYLFFLLNNRRDLAEKRFETFDVLTHECWR